jgi:type II secretory ATPase GspE/PulE/Tfp pilus assembly ATPase PilB-like protein
MDTVVSRCPHCQRRLTAPVRLIDTVVHCPACHQQFRLHPASSGDRVRDEAERLGFRFLELHGATPSPAALRAVPALVARQERILPMAIEGETLTVAMGAPPGPETLDRLRFLLNRPIQVVVAPPAQVQEAIARRYPGGPPQARPVPEPHAASEARPASAPVAIDFVEMEPTEAEEAPAGQMPDPDGAAVVRLVQSMVFDALQWGASRIFIGRVNDRMRIAYRIADTVVLREDPPQEMLFPLLVKLMTMCSLSGAVKLLVGGKERRLQVAFKSTPHGLAAVIHVPADAAAVVESCCVRASRQGFKFVALDAFRAAPKVLATVPETVARQNRIMPVELDGETLVVAVHDARSAETLDGLRFMLNRTLTAVMAPEGALLAAIERNYGHADREEAETLEAALSESLQPAAEARPHEPLGEPSRGPARTLLAHLRRIYSEPALELFETIRARPKLCRQDHASGALEVVFPHAHLLPMLPFAARRYIENKIWVLREAIISRLENFLERDELVRGLAMSYAQYLACRAMSEGQEESINPATARDAWVNFLYGFTLHAFPTIDSNGALATLVTEELDQLTERLYQLVDDREMVVEPAAARWWLSLIDQQTTTGDVLDYRSPTIIHLVDLLLAEAIHHRASRIVLVPDAERVEVAFLVQTAAYAHDPLPLRFHLPMLARLLELAAPDGSWRWAAAERERTLRAQLRLSEYGLAALIEILPDQAAAEECQAAAVQTNRPLVELREIEIPKAILAAVPMGVARKKVAIPLSLEGNTLTVALAQPPSPRRLDELRLVFNRAVEYVLAPEDEILAAIYRHYLVATQSGSVSPEAVALLHSPVAAEA